MSWAGRWVVLVMALAVVSVGCMSSNTVGTTNTEPTPVPTPRPVFIPTTAPAPPTPVVEVTDTAADEPAAADTDGTAADDATDANLASEDGTDDTAEPTATVTAGPTPTPTADIIVVPTPTPRPAAPRPTPRPTAPPAPLCPGGQILISGSCSCPSGQTNRPGDGQCVRFCSQAELTISNTCVCAGDLYDNGGQCVKRCLAGEVPDNFGGCKQPGPNAIN